MKISNNIALNTYKYYQIAKCTTNYQNIKTDNSFQCRDLYNKKNSQVNYVPSFGYFKHAGYEYVIDRQTGKKVKAQLKRDEYDNEITYKMLIKNKEAGYMDMDIYDDINSKSLQAFNERGEIIPYISQIISNMGDRYKGIGTQLIKKAIEESKKAGRDGELCLYSTTGYMSSFYDYRKDENPIPFYYKMGFESADKEQHKLILDCINNKDYKNLPHEAKLILKKEKIK